ncbi:MAG: nuclear transport factor 2 family protein [Solirubrobacteraceae bacterium]
MSQENVDRLRKSFEHYFATGEPDWSALDENVEVHDHDILDAGEYRGLAGYARWFEDFGSAWSSFSLEPEEYVDAGDCAIAVFRLRATGVGSGVTVERQDAMVCTMRDLKVVRIDYYNNRAQAVESVGLSE